jgi:hypothetical protein
MVWQMQSRLCIPGRCTAIAMLYNLGGQTPVVCRLIFIFLSKSVIRSLISHLLFSAMTFCKLLVAVGIASATAAAHTIPQKRATIELGSLYAYGMNVSGLPLIDVDGVAMLGWTGSEKATFATNLTCE